MRQNKSDQGRRRETAGAPEDPTVGAAPGAALRCGARGASARRAGGSPGGRQTGEPPRDDSRPGMQRPPAAAHDRRQDAADGAPRRVALAADQGAAASSPSASSSRYNFADSLFDLPRPVRCVALQRRAGASSSAPASPRPSSPSSRSRPSPRCSSPARCSSTRRGCSWRRVSTTSEKRYARPFVRLRHASFIARRGVLLLRRLPGRLSLLHSRSTQTIGVSPSIRISEYLIVHRRACCSRSA